MGTRPAERNTRQIGSDEHPKFLRFRWPAGRMVRLGVLVVIAGLSLLAAGCHTPTSVTFVVNDSGDAGDANPNDGLCRTAAGTCTLRAAIEQSNNYSNQNIIEFDLPAGDTEIVPSSPLPTIQEDLVIDGTTQPGYDGVTPVVRISGADLPNYEINGIFIAGGTPATIKALQISDFSLNGVFSLGGLILEHSIVSANHKGGISLGGINAGTRSISDSLIEGNGSTLPHSLAGGIEITSGAMTIQDTQITGNTGYFAGGIWLSHAILHLSASTLTGNTGVNAGGIYAANKEGTELWVENGTRIGMPGAGNTGGYVAGYGITMGGIFTKADTRISDSYVEANTGNGIHAQGGADGGISLRVANSTVNGNSQAGVSANLANVDLIQAEILDNENGGVSITAGSLITVVGSISGNHANGGIEMENGFLNLNATTVHGNDHLHSGGGVRATDMKGVDVSRSTISGNSSSEMGGGLYLSTVFQPIEIANSTISGNESALNGGGLAVLSGPAFLTNVTLTGNAAPAAGGVQSTGSVEFVNSILAQNSGTNCGSALPNIVGSLGHNLDDDLSCAFGASGDLSGVDAGIGPLQDNGGATLTHALLPGSPAIDAADDGNCPMTDQRFVFRPVGVHCDIGAFEAESSVTATPPSITGTSTPTPTPTGTPTPALSKILFDPVLFSSDVIYSKYARTCVPRGVTIEVMVSPVELVRSVGLFFRLEEKNGTNVTPWSEGYSMIRDGSGVYALVLNSEDFPDEALKWGNEAWLAVQFVANGKDGQPIARSEVYRRVTLGQCRK